MYNIGKLFRSNNVDKGGILVLDVATFKNSTSGPPFHNENLIIEFKK